MTKTKELLLMDKKRIGIAIYPNHAPKDKIIKYLKQAKKYGFKRVFTNLIELSRAEIKNFIEICQVGKAMGMEMVVDVDDKAFKMLGHSLNEQTYFKKIGVNTIRLDVDFDAQKIANLTLKKEIEYEINASMFSGIEKALAKIPFNANYLVASHNFYPQLYTGLSKEKFLKANKLYQKLGVKISAFVTIPSAKAISAWKDAKGTPTLEMHRKMELLNQIQHMGLIESIDIIMISNMYLSDQQMLAISKLKTNQISFKINKHPLVTTSENKILNWQEHQIRGDNGDFFLRSIIPREKFINLKIAPRKHKLDIFKKGDVVILNEKAGRYKGELHILKKDIEATSDKNFIGTIALEQIPLLDLDKAFLKFNFWK